MKEELIPFIKDRSLVTERVEKLISFYSKAEVCDMMGISFPTLKYRMKTHKWKMKEIELIIEKMPC